MTQQRRRWADVRRTLIQSDEDRLIYDETGVAVRLGAQIRDARIAAGLSQKALADRAGVKQQAVARFEGGDVEPTIRTVMRLSRALGMEFHPVLVPVGGRRTGEVSPDMGDGSADVVMDERPVDAGKRLTIS